MSTIHSSDSLKAIRETLCLAEAALIDRADHGIDTEAIRWRHLDHISNLLDDIDRQRPLGPDGTHSDDLHTDSCGCER